jgi:uncharacterized protein
MQKIKKHRVVIDTNLWISFLLTKNFTKIDPLFSNNTLILLFSQELLDEFTEVAQRPKFKKYFPTFDFQNLLNRILMKAQFATVKTAVDVCRDPKDNFLLALAVDGKATHLITGDKDLLVLETFGQTKILTISDYIIAINKNL